MDAAQTQKRLCPGCRTELDVISAAGRADDLYLCSNCYNSWFAFELAKDDPMEPTHEVDE